MQGPSRIKGLLAAALVASILHGGFAAHGQRKRAGAKPGPAAAPRKPAAAPRKPAAAPRKPAAAPRKPAAPAPKVAAAEAKPPVLDTTGLQAHDFYAYVHDGRFTRFKNDLRFKIAFEIYVTSFSDMCKSSLSEARVEITKFVRTYRDETIYSWGGRGFPIPLSTTSKLESEREVGTGYFAEPTFAEEYVKLTGGYMRDFAKRVGSGSTDANSVLDAIYRTLGDMVELTFQTRSDMAALLTKNGCGGPATRRFSDNLLRFAKGQPSAQAERGEKSFFERECEGKIARLFPEAGPRSCRCIYRELTAAMPIELVHPLEDEFDADDFTRFLTLSVSRAGLQQKVSACVRQ
jgi:hypothetical protein